MARPELIYEIEAIETRPERDVAMEVQILTLERELRFERRQHEKTRIERDLARIRNRQFERLADSLAKRIDELQGEIKKMLFPNGRAA